MSTNGTHTSIKDVLKPRSINMAITTLTVLLVANPMMTIAQQATSGSNQISHGRHSNQHPNGKNKNPETHRSSQTSIALNGIGNNKEQPQRGASGQLYSRIAPANYADDLGIMIEGPELRYISNRIFADRAQNLFSQNSVTQ